MSFRRRLVRAGTWWLLLAVVVATGTLAKGRLSHATDTVARFDPSPAFVAYNANSFVVNVIAENVHTLREDTPETGSQCGNAVDDDGDGKVNDGCPASLTAEDGLPCDDAADDDGDAMVNDGCPPTGPEPESIVCADAIDNDADGKVNDGCPANGGAETGAQCTNSADDDADGFVNDGCPAAGDSEFIAVCSDTLDSDGDGIVNDGCPASGAPETGNQCSNAVDDDADGRVNDGCPAGGMRSETGSFECGDAIDNDGDTYENDGCPAVNAAESACTNAISDDSDGLVNDGCPQVGSAPESGVACFDAVDNDGDGRVNDGCPSAPEPEVLCDDALDSDGDGLVNDGCPIEENCSKNPGEPTGDFPCGLGAFSVTVTWPATKLQYLSHTRGSYITSTGRSLFADPCPATVTSSSLSISCFTTGSTPLGPDGTPEAGTACANAIDDDGDLLVNDGCPAVGAGEVGTACSNTLDDDADGMVNDGCPSSAGTGTLVSIVLRPLGEVGETIVLDQSSVLVDITGREIAHVDLQGSVLLRRCADVNESGHVSLADVLAILPHVGKTSSSPDWPTVSKYDLNQSGTINLSDALYALAQVGQTCTFTP